MTSPRKSSILKPSKCRISQVALDVYDDRESTLFGVSRRVSFSGKKNVKVFHSNQEEGTVWHNSYEVSDNETFDTPQQSSFPIPNSQTEKTNLCTPDSRNEQTQEILSQKHKKPRLDSIFSILDSKKCSNFSNNHSTISKDSVHRQVLNQSNTKYISSENSQIHQVKNINISSSCNIIRTYNKSINSDQENVGRSPQTLNHGLKSHDPIPSQLKTFDHLKIDHVEEMTGVCYFDKSLPTIINEDCFLEKCERKKSMEFFSDNCRSFHVFEDSILPISNDAELNTTQAVMTFDKDVNLRPLKPVTSSEIENDINPVQNRRKTILFNEDDQGADLDITRYVHEHSFSDYVLPQPVASDLNEDDTECYGNQSKQKTILFSKNGQGSDLEITEAVTYSNYTYEEFTSAKPMTSEIRDKRKTILYNQDDQSADLEITEAAIYKNISYEKFILAKSITSDEIAGEHNCQSHSKHKTILYKQDNQDADLEITEPVIYTTSTKFIAAKPITCDENSDKEDYEYHNNCKTVLFDEDNQDADLEITETVACNSSEQFIIDKPICFDENADKKNYEGHSKCKSLLYNEDNHDIDLEKTETVPCNLSDKFISVKPIISEGIADKENYDCNINCKTILYNQDCHDANLEITEALIYEKNTCKNFASSNPMTAEGITDKEIDEGHSKRKTILFNQDCQDADLEITQAVEITNMYKINNQQDSSNSIVQHISAYPTHLRKRKEIEYSPTNLKNVEQGILVSSKPEEPKLKMRKVLLFNENENLSVVRNVQQSMNNESLDHTEALCHIQPMIPFHLRCNVLKDSSNTSSHNVDTRLLYICDEADNNTNNYLLINYVHPLAEKSSLKVGTNQLISVETNKSIQEDSYISCCTKSITSSCNKINTKSSVKKRCYSPIVTSNISTKLLKLQSISNSKRRHTVSLNFDENTGGMNSSAQQKLLTNDLFDHIFPTNTKVPINLKNSDKCNAVTDGFVPTCSSESNVESIYCNDPSKHCKTDDSSCFNAELNEPVHVASTLNGITSSFTCIMNISNTSHHEPEHFEMLKINRSSGHFHLKPESTVVQDTTTSKDIENVSVRNNNETSIKGKMLPCTELKIPQHSVCDEIMNADENIFGYDDLSNIKPPQGFYDDDRSYSYIIDTQNDTNNLTRNINQYSYYKTLSDNIKSSKDFDIDLFLKKLYDYENRMLLIIENPELRMGYKKTSPELVLAKAQLKEVTDELAKIIEEENVPVGAYLPKTQNIAFLIKNKCNEDTYKDFTKIILDKYEWKFIIRSIAEVNICFNGDSLKDDLHVTISLVNVHSLLKEKHHSFKDMLHETLLKSLFTYNISNIIERREEIFKLLDIVVDCVQHIKVLETEMRSLALDYKCRFDGFILKKYITPDSGICYILKIDMTDYAKDKSLSWKNVTTHLVRGKVCMDEIKQLFDSIPAIHINFLKKFLLHINRNKFCVE